MSYCDFDQAPLFFGENIFKARKEYRCCECHQPINVGQLYWRCIGKWETFDSFKQHIECRDACYTIQKYDDCICFGDLQNWMAEFLEPKRIYWHRQVRVLFAMGKRASRMKTPEQIARYNAKWIGRKTETP